MCSPEGASRKPNAIEQYAGLFVQRKDAYARQREHSRLYYHCKKPVTDDVLRAHLTGDLTIGLHSLRTDGRSDWAVVDSDEGLYPIYEAKDALRKTGMESYVEQSRAGGHLWLFFEQPQQPSSIKKILSKHARGREIFPAGDIPDEDGYGLVIRGPLGIHRAVGIRYPFLNDNCHRVSEGEVRGQLQWLVENVRRIPTEAIVLPQDASKPARRSSVLYDSPIRVWNESHAIADVVGTYTLLSRNGMAHCVWPQNHNLGDRHKCLKVYEKTNRWYCFSERCGGDPASFLMRYHGLTPHAFYQMYCERVAPAGGT